MLLQSLHQYAKRHRLLETLPFQLRTVHLLIPLDREGRLRGSGLVTVYTPDAKGKARVGRDYSLPRFPGENNGGKAYFLAENYSAVLGVVRDTGEPLPVEPQRREERNPVFAFRHFWQRIEDAQSALPDEPRLRALLEFKRRYLHEEDGRIVLQAPLLEQRANERTGKPELCLRTEGETWVPVKKASTLCFEVDGEVVFLNQPDDPIRGYWERTFTREAFAVDEGTEEETVSAPKATLCLVSEEIGKPVARSHKPKILGVPGLASGGYLVSFAKEAPAFSSFGFEMGENAPVSQEAAASYALALNRLLENEDTTFRVGEVAFCFWATEQASLAARVGSMMNRPKPATVRDFLVSPFAGTPREVARKDRFHSVALSANAGRVVVKQWLREPLDDAILNLVCWFKDLEIVEPPYYGQKDGEEGQSLYSLFRLAATTVREAKQLKTKSDLITVLYRAAVERLNPSLSLLKPICNEFLSALVRAESLRPPFNPSRFALIKLILRRSGKKEEFMPDVQLADTADAAYNLGRLLHILATLQDQAHEYQLEGPGVVERYYGGASTAPAVVFGLLWRLHNFHLRKLEQQGEKGHRSATAIRNRIAEITGKFPPAGQNQPPQFPALLTLEEQARFALGFYQQRAADLHAIKAAKEAKGAREQPTEQPRV